MFKTCTLNSILHSGFRLFKNAKKIRIILIEIVYTLGLHSNYTLYPLSILISHPFINVKRLISVTKTNQNSVYYIAIEVWHYKCNFAFISAVGGSGLTKFGKDSKSFKKE